MYYNTIIAVITNDSLLPHSQVSNYPSRYKDGTFFSETCSFVLLHYTRKVVIIKNREIWVHRHFHNISLPVLVQRQMNPVYSILYCTSISILILWYPLHMVLSIDFFPLGFHLKCTSIICSELSVSRRMIHRVTKCHVGCSADLEITTVPKKTFRWNSRYLTLHKPKIRTVNVRSLYFTYAPQRHASVFVCGQSKPWGKQNNHIALE